MLITDKGVKSGLSTGGPYCIVYFPHSIDACGSELRFSRRMTIFAFALGSESSASDYSVLVWGAIGLWTA